jgi:hypothetical protein
MITTSALRSATQRRQLASEREASLRDPRNAREGAGTP